MTARTPRHAQRQTMQNITRGRGTRKPTDPTSAPGQWKPPARKAGHLKNQVAQNRRRAK